jgi:hypothetical protein
MNLVTSRELKARPSTKPAQSGHGTCAKQQRPGGDRPQAEGEGMSKRKAPDTTWKKIGTLCIDTGTLALADPCYIDSAGLDSYPKNGLSRQVRKKLTASAACKHRKSIPTVVTLMTGMGDGFYDVFAELVDMGAFGQRIKGIHIEFISDREI